MKSIIDNENLNILIEKFEEIKIKNIKNVMNFDIKPRKNYYIIYDKQNKSNNAKETLKIL